MKAFNAVSRLPYTDATNECKTLRLQRDLHRRQSAADAPGIEPGSRSQVAGTQVEGLPSRPSFRISSTAPVQPSWTLGHFQVSSQHDCIAAATPSGGVYSRFSTLHTRRPGCMTHSCGGLIQWV